MDLLGLRLSAGGLAGVACVRLGHDPAAVAACSLSRRERGGVRGYKLSIGLNPLTPTLSPMGRGSPAVPWFESVFNNKVCIDKSISTSSPPAAAAAAPRCRDRWRAGRRR